MEAKPENKELLLSKTGFFEGDFSAPPELGWHHKVEGGSFIGLLIVMVGEGPVLADRFLVREVGSGLSQADDELVPQAPRQEIRLLVIDHWRLWDRGRAHDVSDGHAPIERQSIT